MLYQSAFYQGSTASAILQIHVPDLIMVERESGDVKKTKRIRMCHVEAPAPGDGGDHHIMQT